MKQETIQSKRVRPPKRVKHVILRGGRRVSRPDGLTSYGVRVPHRADWGISRTWRRAAALKFALPLLTAQSDREIPPQMKSMRYRGIAACARAEMRVEFASWESRICLW